MLDKYTTMVRTCFANIALFERARQTAFEFFLNKDRDVSCNSERVSMSEVLAIYTDSILRKGGGLKAIVEGGKSEEDFLRQIV
jgi:hypothetical protein